VRDIRNGVEYNWERF